MDGGPSRGYLRKTGLSLPVSGTPRCSLGPLEKGEKAEKDNKKHADLG